MNRKTAEKEDVDLIKYQIYLTLLLQTRFAKYLKENFTEGDKVYSATFRKAIDEFLEKRGY